MAATYTIVYTYTGQSTWTPSQRIVDFSKFKASGDTDKTIVQVLGVKFERWHGTTSGTTKEFSAQLVTSSNEIITSDAIDVTLSSDKHTKVTNNFVTLPTASQLANLSTIRFLVDGSYAPTGSPSISWSARPANPMKLIVTFTDEPPWVYHPQILDFEVKRGTSTGTLSESGTRALLNIRLSLDDSTATESIVLTYYLGNSANAMGTVNLTSYLNTLLSGVTNNTSYVTASFSTDADYRFELTFTAGNESAKATAWLSNSFCSLHIAPYSTGGVAIGDLSTASENNPKFEVHHPTYLYGGIAQIGNDANVGVLTALGVQGGTVAAVSLPIQNYSDGTITFPKAFSAAPSIATTIFATDSINNYADHQAGECAVVIRSISTTGFTYRLLNGRGSARTIGFTWMAIGSSTTSSGGTTGGGGGDEGGGETGATSTPASHTALGAVQIGNGLNIDANGVLSLSANYAGNTNGSQTSQGVITFGGDSGYTQSMTIPLPYYRMLRSTDYGETLPTSGLYAGRLFFLKKS